MSPHSGSEEKRERGLLTFTDNEEAFMASQVRILYLISACVCFAAAAAVGGS